jgi:hypothetical protein
MEAPAEPGAPELKSLGSHLLEHGLERTALQLDELEVPVVDGFGECIEVL